jgi:shikimate kinase
MGSGKSTIGRRVAAALGLPFLDNDEMLERATGHSAAELAVRDGVDSLHRAEAAVLLDALRAAGRAVIAAAASTITVPAVRDALREETVVWLRADPATLVARLPGSDVRPFADEDPARLVQEQSRERDSRFREVADVIHETDKTDIEGVVERVLSDLAES